MDTAKNQATTLKKISQKTIDRIAQLSADELCDHGIIEPAKVNGYICPCGSGSGENGTGFSANPKIENATVFHCFSCGNNFSVLALCAAHFGLDRQVDFAELVKKTCAEFAIDITYDDFSMTAGKRTARTKPKRKKTRLEPHELKRIKQDLNAPLEPLKEFLRYQPNQNWRGFDYAFMIAHGWRFASSWTNPKNQTEPTTRRMLIPAQNLGYLARLVDSEKSYDRPQMIKPKVHVGRKQLYNPQVLSERIVFCCEGYLDAASLELAGFAAVATGGAAEGDLLIEELDKLDTKPKIIILFENDRAGITGAENLRDDLLSKKIPAVTRYLDSPKSTNEPTGDSGAMRPANEIEKIDANSILVEFGVDVLRGTIEQILDDSLSELAAVSSELNRKDSAGLTAADWDFLFSGDGSDLDFARRIERFAGERIRWLTDDERWLLYDGGTWKYASSANSCIVPIANDLADKMKQNAETDDEIDLADKLKSAKKASLAISMLKGCRSILITSDDLDRHKNLLNCLNGVVDLQDGKLYPAAPELHITQQCNAVYDANAQSTVVDKFFTDIQPDETTRRGLIRWLAYNLTAENIIHRFAIWTGGGGNGKGTLSGILLKLLGAYATGLAPRALLRRRNDLDADKATTALNVIEKKRFAVSEELPLDGELDSSLVKNLSGGDEINLRRNFGEYRTVENFCKLNISGNYLPKIENIHDEGLLRRLMNFNFAVKFGTAEHPADSHLREKLLQPENLSALLTLLVREAQQWYKESSNENGGLIISALMRKATQEHLAANDFIRDFIDDNFVFAPNASVKVKDFLDELKLEYPRECSRYKRNDLIQQVAKVDGVEYGFARANVRVFKGIGRLATDLTGTPIDDNCPTPFDN